MTIGINDPLDAFEALCIERGACGEALAWLSSRREAGDDMRAMIALLSADQNKQGWAVWARLTLADQLSFAVRIALSDHGTRDDPRMAAHLDIYVATSQTEGDLLAGRWNADELPTIARQLEDGVVERKRG